MTAREQIKEGVRNVAQRMVNAQENFIADVMEQFGKTQEQAEKVLNVFRKAKAIKLDAVMGRYDLKHGAFWEQEVIDRAVSM